MPDGLPQPLQVQIPTDLQFVRPVRKMLEGLLRAQGWEEDDIDDTSLIITEIVQNAVEHGSKGDGNERIDITLHIQAEAVEMVVLDPGTGEDPHLAVERDIEKPVPMEEARGRGLFLIYRLAGTFERRLDDTGGLLIRARKEIGS